MLRPAVKKKKKKKEKEKSGDELPKRFALQPIFFCGETEQCQAFDEIQRNTLKQSLWQFIPLKPKVMFPFVSKRKTISFDIWAAIPMEELVSPHQEHEKGATFKETPPLNLTIPNMFQCVNQRKGRTAPDLSGLFSSTHTHPREKTWTCALFHGGEILGFCDSSQSCGFRGLAHLAPSRFQNIQIYQHPHSHSAGDTHSSVSSVSFSLKILIFWWIWAPPPRPPPPPPTTLALRMASMLSELMRPNLHSKCYQNYH